MISNEVIVVCITEKRTRHRMSCNTEMGLETSFTLQY